MPRKRNDLGPIAEKVIADLMARGRTAEAIAKELAAKKIRVSRATIGRRMRELRGAVASPRASSRPTLRESYAMPDPSPPSDDGKDEQLPDPEAIPKDADLAQIEQWLRRADAMGKRATELGDLPGMGQMGRLTSALLEAKRRATPPEKLDPNDSPDMVAAANRAREQLHRLIDQAIGRE